MFSLPMFETSIEQHCIHCVCAGRGGRDKQPKMHVLGDNRDCKINISLFNEYRKTHQNQITILFRNQSLLEKETKGKKQLNKSTGRGLIVLLSASTKIYFQPPCLCFFLFVAPPVKVHLSRSTLFILVKDSLAVRDV